MGTAARDPGTGTGEHQGHSASPRPGSGGLPGENGAERADEEGTGRSAAPCHSSLARAAAHGAGRAAPAAVVGRPRSSPRGDTLGTRRASSATAAESQGPPPKSATQCP